MLRLANAHLEVELDPEHGAEILSVRRPGGPNVLATYDWATPLWASRSRTYGDDELDWLSEYRGGWQELFPNAGSPCTVLDVPLPFHGEASRATWEVTESEAASAVLRTPARLPLILERRMRLAPDRPALLVEESVRSDAPVTVPFLWGHHPAFPAPEGARIDLPDGLRVAVDATWTPDLSDLQPGTEGVWPAVWGRGAGEAVGLDVVGAGPLQRLVYLSGLPDPAWAAIRGVSPGLGVAMAWDGAAYPCAWQWWEIGGPGHPWHGRARLVAIEPNTAWPADGLAAADARGDAHRLAPGEERRAWLTLSLFDADERPVRGVDRDGRVDRGDLAAADAAPGP
jgi:hypothetical protein